MHHILRLSSFTQDPTGSVQDLTVGSFTYNQASQITGYGRSNDSYAWGGHYNVNRSYATNGLNQLTSAGGTALGYDGRGNLTTSGSNAYGYTSENRLVTAPNGVSIGYDPTGRIQQLTQGANTTRLEHLGPRMISERNAGGSILRRYVHGPNDDDPVVWYEGAGTTDKRWLHTDERGSVVAITNSTGSAFAINAYDEYGIPASTNIGRFQYTGQAWLPELGLYYYKARMYSPTLGRFMQTDPIGYGDGINWYDYVSGDPVNMVDPTGLDSVDCDGNVPEDGEIVVCGNRARAKCDDDCADLYKDALDADYRWKNIQENERVNPGHWERYICSLPPIELTVGVDAYVGPGASASVGGSVDLNTFQFRGVVKSAGGVGYGGGLGFSIGPGSKRSGGSVERNVTVAAGPGSASFSDSGPSVGKGPAFGPKAGFWGGAAVTYTSEPTINLTGQCNIKAGQ